MTAIVPSATILGVDGQPVAVEVHVSQGLPGYNVVGLPDAACRESRDRVRAALLSSELQWPLKRVTVNLAPSSVRKGGPGLDLPIAVGLLVANGDLALEAIAGIAFLGELGLDGSIRRVPGVVPMVEAINERVIVVPPDGAEEAMLVGRHRVRVASTMAELVACLRGDAPWPDPPPPAHAPPGPPGPDLADVRGQHVGRVALEVCAAGGHHLLLCGARGLRRRRSSPAAVRAARLGQDHARRAAARPPAAARARRRAGRNSHPLGRRAARPG